MSSISKVVLRRKRKDERQMTGAERLRVDIGRQQGTTRKREGSGDRKKTHLVLRQEKAGETAGEKRGRRRRDRDSYTYKERKEIS